MKLRVAYNPEMVITPVAGNLIRVMHFDEDETHGDRWGVCVLARIKKGSIKIPGEHWWPLRFFESLDDANEIVELYTAKVLSIKDIEQYVLSD